MATKHYFTQIREAAIKQVKAIVPRGLCRSFLAHDPYKTQSSELPSIEFRVGGHNETEDIGQSYNDIFDVVLEMTVKSQGTIEENERLFGEAQKALVSDNSLGINVLDINSGVVEVENEEFEAQTHIIRSTWLVKVNVDFNDPFTIKG